MEILERSRVQLKENGAHDELEVLLIMLIIQ